MKAIRDKIFEDPDVSYAKDSQPLNWHEGNVHPFGVNAMKGIVKVGPRRQTHDVMDSLSGFALKDYEGRIWPDAGVIAFWEAPKKNILMHILKSFTEDKELADYNLSMEDFDDFLFDIPNPDQSSDDEDAIYTLDEYPENPIVKSYMDFKVKLKRPQHTVSPLNKEPRKVGMSNKTGKKIDDRNIWRRAQPFEGLVPESLDESMVGDVEIADTQSYISQMAKSVDDKIDFISKISPDCILDFGCADGYILNAISKKYPNIKGLVGYDLDEKMINMIQSKYPNIEATDNWNEALYTATEHDDVALSLMSVIHEVYSYSSPQTIHKFWRQQVFNPKFKYVVIRDMMPSKEYMHMKPSKEDIMKLKKKLWKMKRYQSSFEQQWGKITDNLGNMIHWLLKYDYKSNWGREVKENYLPVSIETVKNKIPGNWKIIYEDYYIFKPIADKVMKDFGIELKYPTHVKMIIENNAR